MPTTVLHRPATGKAPSHSRADCRDVGPCRAPARGEDKLLFYYGDWIKKPGVAIVSCNDGLRPVIMKLEATDEKSKIDYEPVER